MFHILRKICFLQGLLLNDSLQIVQIDSYPREEISGMFVRGWIRI